MGMQEVVHVLRPWFAHRGWHLGSVLPRAAYAALGTIPDAVGLGYDDRGRRTLFPVWVVPEVTPRVLEVVEHFQRRWPEAGALWPVPVEHAIPLVGALRWTPAQLEDVTRRGAQALTPADADVQALMAALQDAG